MLRDALWSVLWTDSDGDHSAPGAALFASLTRHGGALYGKLYERNCRRCDASARRGLVATFARVQSQRSCRGEFHLWVVAEG
jgi:hypothetical protein